MRERVKHAIYCNRSEQTNRINEIDTLKKVIDSLVTRFRTTEITKAIASINRSVYFLEKKEQKNGARKSNKSERYFNG